MTLTGWIGRGEEIGEMLGVEVVGLIPGVWGVEGVGLKILLGVVVAEMGA